MQSMRHPFVAILVVSVAAPIQAQTPAAERASVVTVLGRDTVAIESFVRTVGHVEGDIVIRCRC